MSISMSSTLIQGVTMDVNMLGDFLRKTNPISPTSFDQFTDDNKSPNIVITLPTILPILPIRLTNRRGARVTLCGIVEEGTKEYGQGFRYYGSTGDFYRQDGRLFENHDSPDDLVSVFIPQSEADLNQDDVEFKWVHPKHLNFKSFFIRLNPARILPRQGKYYLNRMGFIIHLKDDDVHRLIDDDGSEYYRDGCIDQNHSSMFDLTYKIRSWDVFSKSNWAKEVISLEEKTISRPEMFNPLNDQKEHLMTELLKTLIKANEIARSIDHEFGFHLTPINKYFD